MRILIVDDDQHIAALIVRALMLDGHKVSTVGSLGEARNAPFRLLDLVIVDLGLPDGSGAELCFLIRQREYAVRILILTAYSGLDVRISALDAGADDFVCKPFELAELRARVRALGRRGPLSRSRVHVRGDVVLNFDSRRAQRADSLIPLTAREWAILDFLTTRAGRFCGREDLLTAVWGEASKSAANSFNVLLVRLRRKLGSDIIETSRGNGYALGGTIETASEGRRLRYARWR